MEAEHCARAGCDLPFPAAPGKTHSCTTPKVEWTLVMDRKGKGHELPAAVAASPLSRRKRIPDVDELMRLESSQAAKLTEEEVMAVVLYTGPMVR